MIKTETYYIILNRKTDNFLAFHPAHISFLTGYMETTASDRAMKFGSTLEDGEKVFLKATKDLDKALDHLNGLSGEKFGPYYQNMLRILNNVELVLVKADVVTKTELTTIIKER